MCMTHALQLNIEKLEARVVFVTILPDKLELRYDFNKYIQGPFAVLRQQISLAFSMFGAMLRVLTQPALNEQVCVYMYMYMYVGAYICVYIYIYI
jgi:hypothetical protein